MITISLTTFRDLIEILKQKSLKEIFLGKKVSLRRKERSLLTKIKDNPKWFAKADGRKGNFMKKDIIHKGKGIVYLLSSGSTESILLFDNKVKIQSGPDLYVYLSTKNNAKARILNLGLLKGTKGGQSYTIKEPISRLQKYRYVLIYCKKFEVLFTYASLR